MFLMKCASVCGIINYWQCWLEMMVSDLCHVVVDSVVFIARLYLVVNVVL